MHKNHGKISNLGALTDAAYVNFRTMFSAHAAANGIIAGIFIAAVALFSFLYLGLLWDAIPNFTGNQLTTDGIIIGIFVVFMLLIVAFFLAWQGAAAVAVSRNQDESMAVIIKCALKSAWPALTISLAQILVFLPALAGVAAMIIINPAQWGAGAFLHATVIAAYVLVILLRTVSFFATNVALAQDAHFFTPILRSASTVRSRGFFRIFVITLFITTVNLAIFGILLVGLLNLFGQVPADLGDWADILYNPTWFVAALLLAYLPLAFVLPKLGVLARRLYSPTAEYPDTPRLASRSMSTALDLVIVGGGFAVIFYVAATIFTGDGRNPFQVSPGAAATTAAAFFVVFTIYNIYFEVFEGGKTLGKRLFGLEVVTNHGESPDFVKSLIRNVFRVVDIFTFVVMIFTAKHQRVGDMMSLTGVEYVVEAEEDVF